MASGCLTRIVVDDSTEAAPTLDVALGRFTNLRHRTALVEALVPHRTAPPLAR